MTHTVSRRAVVAGALVAGALGPVLALFGAQSRADSLTPLDATDSNAKALNFAPDAAKVDKQKNPTYKPGQRCAGCAHFKGKPTDPMAPCETFPGHSVPADGWCMVWGARAG